MIAFIPSQRTGRHRVMQPIPGKADAGAEVAQVGGG
jgi:hypothetical protein